MRFVSVKHKLPSRVITNEEVLEQLQRRGSTCLTDAALDAFVARTRKAFELAGTDVRYQLAEGERPYDLCTEAGLQALREGGVQPEDVDLLIYASIGRGFIEPATANVFQDLLGLRNATCFDVVDACASWLRAVDVAEKFLRRSDKCRHVLIITGEFISKYAYRYNIRSEDEFEHWFPGVTVGEAATATLLSRDDDAHDFASEFRTWGERRALCMIPLENYEDYLGAQVPGDRRLAPLQFASFGGELLQIGAGKLVTHFRQAVDFNSLDYDLIFGHPASDAICSTIGRRCGLDFGGFQFTHGLYGNTASSSVPLAMSTARQNQRLLPGSRVLVLFASAGLSTVLMRFVWAGASNARAASAPHRDRERVAGVL